MDLESSVLYLFMYTVFMRGKSLSLGIELIGLITVTLLALFYSYSPLIKYDMQIVAGMLIVFFIARRFFHDKKYFYFAEALLFVFITLAVVFTTGGIHSPFFFLLYFLLFALVIVLDSASSIILTLLLVVLFLTTQEGTGIGDYIPVLSLPFVVPFAQYLGYLRKKAHERERIERKFQEEKQETLLFLTTTLFRHVEDIRMRLDDFRGDMDLLYVREKVEKLKELVHRFVHYVEKI